MDNGRKKHKREKTLSCKQGVLLHFHQYYEDSLTCIAKQMCSWPHIYQVLASLLNRWYKSQSCKEGASQEGHEGPLRDQVLRDNHSEFRGQGHLREQLCFVLSSFFSNKRKICAATNHLQFRQEEPFTVSQTQRCPTQGKLSDTSDNLSMAWVPCVPTLCLFSSSSFHTGCMSVIST